MRVVDLFSGCGGISSGFQMAGFDVVFGLDSNRDSCRTFERNFPSAVVACKKIEDLEAIEIPDADIIVGGPPCVNFSTSKGGRANVLEGLTLVQTFLRLVWKRKPKYWLMENVPRVGLHLPDDIPLRWIGIDEEGFLDVPVRKLFDVTEYGVPQRRRRLIIGNYPIPAPTHVESSSSTDMFHADRDQTRTLGDIVSTFPEPIHDTISGEINDPLYPFSIDARNLTDHYYDSTIAPLETEKLRMAKQEHPYMGRMPFPEPLDRSARTVVALQMGRETMVLPKKSEGFRRPTVRECASIQSFPISFQFSGNTIASRYRQVGNAVPPALSYAIAREIASKEGIRHPSEKPLIYRPDSFPAANTSSLHRSKPRKIDYSKNRRILFPGKEVRGFRIEIESSSLPAGVSWKTLVHVGEGKRNHSVLSFEYQAAKHMVEASLESNFPQWVTSFQNMIRESEGIDVAHGKTIHNALHEENNQTLVGLERFRGLIDKYFPKDLWQTVSVQIQQPIPGLEKKTLRVRPLVALPLAKILEDRMNTTEECA